MSDNNDLITNEDLEETTADEAVEKTAPEEQSADVVEETTKDEAADDNDSKTDDNVIEPKAMTEPEAEDAGLVIINADTPEDAKWYVVHTYAGHEKKVAITLKQRAESSGFADRIIKVFIPHQQKIVISEGKKRSVDERLFPGYVIVQMVMSDDAWLMVRSTRGVTGFVGMGSTPTPLPEQEVKTLMKFTKMEAPKFEAKFSVGDSVKIMEGPFRDFLGKVDEVNDDQGKVKVLISFFGKETPVELDFMQVQSL